MTLSTWTYLSTTNPAGVSATPEAVWQCDAGGSALNDRSGNGHTLIKQSAWTDTSFIKVADNIFGLAFDRDIYYTCAVNSGLDITDALTIELVLYMFNWRGTGSVGILSYGQNSSTQANNTLYSLSTNGASRITFKQEYYDTAEHVEAAELGSFIFGYPIYVAITRSNPSGGNQIVSGYFNGKPIEQASLVATNGGSTSEFRLGIEIEAGSTNAYRGVISSGRITNERFSDDSIQLAYNQVRGL